MSAPNSPERPARRGSINLHLHEFSNALLKLLSETKLKDIPTIKNQKLVSFKSTELVKDVFQTLVKNHVTSAPVYDAGKKESFGMVDMKDFVDFIMSLHMKGDPIIFTAEKLSDLSGTDPFIPIDEDTFAVEALREFNIKRVHRMVMTKHGEANNVLSVVTESCIVEWINHHKEKLIPHGQMTVKQLNLGGIDHFHQVISIIETDTLLAALSIIEKYNINGLPVVDTDGKIVGSFSVSDIQYMVADINSEDNIRLGMSVRDFLDKYKSSRPPLITCTPTTKFLEVVSQLVEHKVHRVHVVDADRKPVDIISLSNVVDIVLLFATGQRRR
eukprot:TRINITY_DN2207_c0_g1_i2.p1 TRINITY_DN2207_c0_g1~~TRINITY_DN2207_c0_g1_i2.p1  ORF type:complete len:329 (+),score=96.33 TRINITY_DN2207_c0_g1_i2:124-1110(+)